jgi:predicted lipoprotein with Yx(FWY)xxD motif
MRNHYLIPATCLALLAGCASTGMPPVNSQSGALTNPAGMTLYVFDKDSATKSACNGDCAVKWPPLIAAANEQASGDYSIVTRDDGARQWAFKGKPLYLWFKDQQAGDATGDGVNNVWHIARP